MTPARNTAMRVGNNNADNNIGEKENGEDFRKPSPFLYSLHYEQSLQKYTLFHFFILRITTNY